MRVRGIFKLLGFFMLPILLLGCAENSVKEGASVLTHGLKRQKITIENGRFSPLALWDLGRLGDFSISPEGNRVAYSVKFYDVKANKGFSVLNIINIDGTEQKKLVDLGASIWNVDWGKENRIRFISNHEGSAQIYSIDPDGLRFTQLSSVETGVNGFKYSPDGKHILYTSTIKVVDNARDMHPDLPKNSAKIYTDLMYRHWDSWDDGYRSHIFLASVDDRKIGDAIDIMLSEPYDSPLQPFGGMEEIAWRPDSKAIAYTAKKQVGKKYAFSTNSDIYLYSLVSQKVSNLTPRNPGYDRCPIFSPDGRYMAWLSMERPGFEADKDRLYILDLANGNSFDLSADFDYNTISMCWRSDSKGLYFIAGVQGTKPIFYQDIETRARRQITDGRCDYRAVEIASSEMAPEGVLISARTTMTHPADLYRIRVRDGLSKPVTQINKEILSQVKMPQVTERWVKTTDGKKMLTWVLLPPNFDPSKRYPAILYCQGGPQSYTSQSFSYRWNFALMASQGYIVVIPNRRGMLGFGQQWTDEISKNHGRQEMADLLTAMDIMAQEPYVDEHHMAAVGPSYGGYTVYWLAGNHNKRFKAFIAHCGVFHSEMEFYTTDEMFFDEWEMGGKPWDKENKVAQASFAQSPHHFVKSWDTPILIFEGGLDFRIPYTQGTAAFNAAQMQGVDSKLVYFPDESHWVVKPQNGLLWQKEFFAWLNKYL